MERQTKKILWLCLVAAGVFVSYSNVFHNGFLYGDDEELILRNAYLQDWRYLPRLLSQQTRAGSGISSNFYRPLQGLAYFLLIQGFGMKPWPLQLLNILLHAFNAVCLMLLIQRLTLLEDAPAAVLTLLWALHPIHVEAVANINGTADPLSAGCMLAGLWMFLQGNARISLLCFALSLFSKESACIFPLLLVSYDLLSRGRVFLWKKHLPYWLLLGGYLVFHQTCLNLPKTLNFYSQSNPFTENFFCRLYTLFSVFGKGLSLLIRPSELHPERAWPAFASFWFPPVFISFAVLCGLLFLGFSHLKRKSVLSFGIAWFFISYLPMSNLWAKINALFWEHWFYLPSAGLCLALAAWAARFSRSIREKTAVVCLPLLLLLGWQTLVQNRIWRDPETFGKAVLRYESGSARTWNNYAMALTDAKKYGEAVAAYRRAIVLRDDYPQTHHNLGNLYRHMGDVQAAFREYRRALEMDPKFYFSRLALGEMFLQSGNVGEGTRQLEEALLIYPHLPRVRQLLNQLKRRAGK